MGRFESLEARALLAGEVLISEIMYHASSQDPRDEFIELFNPTPAPINLSGWRFDSGVEYVFSNVSLGASAHLVIAADLIRFQTTHPGLTNVIGGYSGRLSNSGERIALVKPDGSLVDEVRYADEGDWGDRQRGPLDHGHEGWLWVAEHDGRGKSIELVNASVSNDFGHNWTASLVDGGTPGVANSALSINSPPLIVDVSHSPAVPRSSESVTIRVRLLDEQILGLVASVFHRIDGTPTFAQSPMFDDGLHGDGIAGDGVFASALPPQADRTVIEFYISATDATAKTRTYPTPSQPSGQQATNLLYQVDDADYFDDQPLYRIIMTEAERVELADIGSLPDDGVVEQFSEAQMNGTFISVDGTGTEVRYNVGIRNRGKGSRSTQPNNYRVNFHSDRPWHEATSVVLNGRYSGLEVLGSQIMRLAGVDAQDAIAVSLRVNGSDLAAGADPAFRMFGSYAALEVLDSNFTDRHYPRDSAGNFYRGFDPLIYRGEDPNAYRFPLPFGLGYEKQTNQEDDDWQDLIALVATLDPVQTPDALFPQRIVELVDVDQWLKALALHELIGNREQSLPIGGVDDFSLYRGTIDSRFRLIAHDLDTILGLGDLPGGADLPVFRAAAVPALGRLLTHPRFAPTYFKYLHELGDTVLSPQNINPMLDNWLAGFFDSASIDQAKQFLVARRQRLFDPVDPLVPLTVTANSDLPIENGYMTATRAATDLSGTSNAIRTRKVLVDGIPADWSAWQAKWTATNVALRPGVNRVLVQSFDDNNLEVDRTYIDIYRTGPMTEVGGALPAGETHWTVAGGPYHATRTVNVPAGASLLIDPGVTVFFDTGAGLTINGQLLAEGTDLARIRLAKTPGAAGNWRGIQLSDTMAANRLAYVDQESGDAGFGGGARNIRTSNSRLDVDRMNWLGTAAQVLDITNTSIRVSNSSFPEVGNVETIHGVDVPTGGYAIFEGNHLGRNLGNNDIMDFTGVQRPNAVLQILNNVFEGGEGDTLDLDGTDAFIEGNVFKNVHGADPLSPDTSSAVSGGSVAGQTSEWTIVRNFFYNLDHAVLAKEGAFATLVNNTIVNVSVAAINFDEPGRAGVEPGLGVYLDGNIIWDVAQVFKNVDSDGTATQITVNRSILPGESLYPGDGNSNLDPHLLQTIGIADPVNDLRLQLGLGPARGSGPGGRDMGADVPAGAVISGAPSSPTYQTSATLTVGGPEILSYRYRLNGGLWSDDVSPAVPIILAGLVNGVQTLEVIAGTEAGLQRERSAAVATWTVDTAFLPGVRINEVLAQNTRAVNHEGTFPDMIELINEGPGPVDLSGMSLTDDAGSPRKFVFTSSTVLAAGQRLVLFADDPNGTSGIHLGFAIRAAGEGVYLFNRPQEGGGLVDGVTFGQQLEDVALARRQDGSWGAGEPSFGAANTLTPMGNPHDLRINEWLAAHDAPFDHDLIEIYNGDSLPVDLGGLYLTDNPNGWPSRHRIAPLTFAAGGEMAVFVADGDAQDGPDHTNFRLNAQQGMIGLFDADLTPINIILYGSQRPNVSQGRLPDGGGHWEFFDTPTFGDHNPATPSVPPIITSTAGPDTYYVVRAASHLRVYDSIPPSGQPVYSSQLAALRPSLTIDTLGGDDVLVVDTGAESDLGLRLIYRAGTGANKLMVRTRGAQIGAARIDSSASEGMLDTTVASRAQLMTNRLAQNGLLLEDNGRMTLLPGGETSVVTSLTLGDGAVLDVGDNALVVDYNGASPIAMIREQIVSGRGGSGLGATWNAAGINSSAVMQANVANPESRSIGYAENAALPLGAYTTFGGIPVDDTAVLIAFALTGDANLDGAVDDDDVTVFGAAYSPGASNSAWALGDFEYNGFVDDEDATLLGVFYEPLVPPESEGSADDELVELLAAAIASELAGESDDSFWSRLAGSSNDREGASRRAGFGRSLSLPVP